MSGNERAMRDWINAALHPEQRDQPPIEGGVSFDNPPAWSPEGIQRAADRAAQDSAATAAESEGREMLGSQNITDQDEQPVDDTTAGEPFSDAEMEVWSQLSPEDQAVIEKLGADDPSAQQRLLDSLVAMVDSDAETTDQGVPLTDLEQLAWDRAELSPESIAHFESLNPSQQQEVLDQMVDALATTPPGVPLGGYQRPVTASSWAKEMEKLRKSGRYMGQG